ncbi:hypothetical protein [uncultured Imperialibacter sp.]|uniref:DUF6913 domain-containing protein n=1 Tax=uncultured Imperialibacter sp. TaxID=1672639 RepID=UPI0030D8148B|tara:strand:+ start:15216 stop:15737 length:522 start_codon:yes stop_codon:yes gene_type:complete
MLGKLLLPVHTKKAIRKSTLQVSPGYSDADQIGIIFKYLNDEHYEKVLSFIRQIQIDKKEVTTLAFFPKKEATSRYRIPRYSTDNLSVWGKLTSEEIDLFLTRNFDFLINLDTESHEFVDNILSRANAKCKIGHFMVERKDFYQLMIHIDPSTDFEVFLDKIYFYIKKLRANA